MSEEFEKVEIPSCRTKDISGKTFNYWTVVSYAGHNHHGQNMWNVICRCGNKKTIRADFLTSGKHKSCGCKPRGPKIDLIGQKFGDLTVIGLGDKADTTYLWDCQCECGKIITTRGDRLKEGMPTSCGCKPRENKSKIHGKHLHPMYSTWCGMHSRCYNIKQKTYENYGGRGIRVCERWHDVDNFINDMGPKPSPNHKIERIDNDGDYCPENCKWATDQEQANNTRKNRFIEYQGQIKSVSEWSRIVNIDSKTISYRILHGWTPEQTLETKPVYGNRILEENN